MVVTDHDTLASAHSAARRFGLPAKWLLAEAREGRLPCLRAGRRILFSVRAIERALIDRAQRTDAGGTR